MKIILLNETTSTNDEAKKFLPMREDLVVCAARQTGGKGTKGRSFLSDEGGLYCSFLKFYKKLPASEAFRIMAHAATAVCRTAKFFGADPEIKWPNDVYAQGRKLSGILIENGFLGEEIDHSIVGIGINVSNDLSALGGIAVNLSEATSRTLSLQEVRSALIGNFERESSFEEYLSFVRFLGRTVRVTEGSRTYEAVARRILRDGRLEIEAEGIRALSAAEIALRL